MDQTTSFSEPVRIADTQAVLRGTLTMPNVTPHATIVLNGATGVPHRFYGAFAKWLADHHNIACLTYDYRDFGASVTGPMQQSRAIMADWGVTDQQVARDWLDQRFPDVPLWVIGHSLGGFLLPFQRRLDRIARVIAVASGPVHVSDHPWPYQAMARLFWYGHGPALTRMLGYLPGRFSGLGEDLPAGVYLQWRRWCTSRNFFRADFGRTLPQPRWAGVTAPVKLVALVDDPVTPPHCVWKLKEFYSGAPVETLSINPKAHGLGRVGHLRAFSRKNAALWDDLIG
ncbi:alpha/beta fold hydrolase [Pseudaestuariivita rosea]|uniref:alpha/beta hydrolase family protein n=1 Tax=Pseudaestuariivita rosea TaxID=2763263 RepID=UPI001ABB67AA|nr:alpha/beta fold hydrolase [Pseudaestuariivita rosea]